MEQNAGGVLATIACPLTLHDVCATLNAWVERFNDQGLRIDIRGTFRDLSTGNSVFLLDWHFLQSWSELFTVFGLRPLPPNGEGEPGREIRYLIYQGLGELRFRLQPDDKIEESRPGPSK